MKQILKLLPVLLVTASCLTSDTTLSSLPTTDSKFKVQEFKVASHRLSSWSSVSFESGTPMPRYSAFPNWATTACIRRKE